jgi:hypothetical protein
VTYLSEQLADGVLAAHTFADAAGASVLTDSSGNSRSGAYTGVGLGLVPLIGTATAGEFNGSDTFAAVTSAAWMNVINITLEAVIRPYRNNIVQAISARESGTTANRTFQFRMSATGKLELIFWDGAGVVRTVTCATTLSKFTTAHVAFTYDGANVYGYLNGVQDGTLALASTLRVPGGAANLEFGRTATAGGAGSWWVGEIAGHGYYGAALSPTRIAAHAAAMGSGASVWDGSGTWGLVS